MNVIKFFQEKIWIPIFISLLLALFIPPTNNQFTTRLLIPVIMINFFLSCLKIDFFDVLIHVKKPQLMSYLLIIYLLVIPFIIYLVSHLINPEFAIAMLLLTSMPAGASAPMLTNIFEGNTTLSMAISLLANIISPFTILLLFFVLTQKIVTLDLGSLFRTLILVNFLPLICAQIIRKMNKPFIDKTQKYYSFIGILCICSVVYLAIGARIKEIFHIPFGELFINILELYLLFGILYVIGYFIVFWKKKSDKIAIAVTKTYMNNALAIGVAATFFSPKIALLMVLSEIPWATTLGIFKYLSKYLR